MQSGHYFQPCYHLCHVSVTYAKRRGECIRCVDHPFWVPVETLTLGWASLGLPECQFLPWRLEALIKTRKLLKTDPANEILFSVLLRDEK